MNTAEEFDTAAKMFGCRIDTIDGRRRYVSSDEKGRAMVGPQARRRKGWSWFGLKRKKPTTTGHVAVTKTIMLDGAAVDPSMVRLIDMETRFLSTLPPLEFPPVKSTPPTPPAPQKANLFSRMFEGLLSQLYDKEWQEMVKNTALTIMISAVTVFVVALCVRGTLWVVSW